MLFRSWQAKAGFTNEEREKIVESYKEELEKRGYDGEEVDRNIKHWALFRVMQTLGAYGLRGLKEGKPHFLQSIPLALRNLRQILNEELDGEYPELQRVINFL